jgi:hypothetical protein
MFSYLQVRGKCYHFRLRCPADLHGIIKQTEFKKSLKTSSLKTAKVSALPYLQGINKTFSLLRLQYITTEQATERLCSLFGEKHRLPPQKAIKAPQKSNMEALRLSEAVTTYSKDNLEKWSDKTKMEMKGVFRLIIDLIGDMSVESVDRTIVRELKDKLLKLPPNVEGDNFELI